MADKNKMVTGVFRNYLDAERAFDRVLAKGYPNSEVALLMSDETKRTYYETTEQKEKHETGSLATEGMGVGGAIGTVAGAAIGAIMAIGTSIALPGIGIIVAGPIAGALAGAGAGAATGGLIGLLTGYGIPEHNAQVYEDVLKEGGVVIGVHPRDGDEDDLKELFEECNGEHVCTC